MGEIRKQTLQSSFLVYVGFLIGAVNTYFFTKQGLFTSEQYGLYQVIVSMVQILGPLATFGAVAFMNRFYPYYADYLNKRKNDLLGLVLLVSTCGAVVIFGLCVVFEPLVVRKFSEKSKLVIDFYYWVLVYGLFYLYFLVFESYFGTLRRTILPSFLKETLWRLLILLLILLYMMELVSFATFIKLFCCTYLVLNLVMISVLLRTKQLMLRFVPSKVSRRVKKLAIEYTGFVYTNVVIVNVARQIDTLALAGAKGLGDTGVYQFNQFLSSVMQVPIRTLQNIGGALIARHWKDKNHTEINRIYQRSAINLLLMGLFILGNILLNYNDAQVLFGLNKSYSTGKTVFLILALYSLIELGTGINGALLSTSPAWKFELYSGIVLLACSIPLNIFMARYYGMEGVAVATLITFTIYNGIRTAFIYRRFNMWPFSSKTLYALATAVIIYYAVYFCFYTRHGWFSLVARSAAFSLIFLITAWVLRLTPDLHQLADIVRYRLRRLMKR